MNTLTKKQRKLYTKLCDKYNKDFYLLCSFDAFLRGQVNKAYEQIKGYDKTLEHYEDMKAVKTYAENDF